jgi:hypothetical protein
MYASEMASDGIIYTPCIMMIITGVQEILRFCLSNFKGCSIG